MKRRKVVLATLAIALAALFVGAALVGPGASGPDPAFDQDRLCGDSRLGTVYSERTEAL